MLTLKNVGVFRKKNKEYQEDPIEEAQDEDVDASEFEDDEVQPKKQKSRRPKETPFTQQRIASVNPVFTPKSVLPIYLVIAAIFVIFGAVMLNISSHVDDLTIYYEKCSSNAPTDAWGNVPSEHYFFNFHKNTSFDVAPQWRYTAADDSDASGSSENGTCQLRFTIPYDIPNSVYVNYRIENFYGNHRRYVQSFSEDQLNGKNASLSVIKDTVGLNCKPLVTNGEGKHYYPCGLIANAMFNDTFSMELVGVGSTESYNLTNQGITWSQDKDRFKKTEYDASQIAPPPNWVERFPQGYNDSNIPDIHTWEEFQNWMRTPALPKFSRLIRRNDHDDLPAGEYQIDIGLHWPVTEFKGGRKAVYITHGSSIGGKNNFLGIVYLIGGCISIAMAVVILCTHLIAGRRTADIGYLSWNRE